MFVPFLFSCYNHKTPLDWLFNSYSSVFEQNDFWIICEEIYFKQPAFAKYSHLKKSLIPDSLKKELKKVKGGNGAAWVSLLRERYEPLETVLHKYIDEIEKVSGEKVEAFYNLATEYVSLRYVADERNIKVLNFELSLFRAPQYTPSFYLSFHSMQDVTAIMERYLRFSQDFKILNVPVLTKKQLLAMMLSSTPRFSNLINRYNEEPKFEVGISCGYAVYIPALAQNFMSDEELIYTANERYGESNVLTRLHPWDIARATFPVLIKNNDKSANSLEFVLRCLRIASLNGNVSIEAALWGRAGYVFCNCPAYYKSAHSFYEKYTPIEDLYFNWYVLCFIVPEEFFWDTEYIRWRLTEPSEIEIYKKHLDYYCKKWNINPKFFEKKEKLSIKLIQGAKASNDGK